MLQKFQRRRSISDQSTGFSSMDRRNGCHGNGSIRAHLESLGIISKFVLGAYTSDLSISNISVTNQESGNIFSFESCFISGGNMHSGAAALRLHRMLRLFLSTDQRSGLSSDGSAAPARSADYALKSKWTSVREGNSHTRDIMRSEEFL